MFFSEFTHAEKPVPITEPKEGKLITNCIRISRCDIVRR